MHYYSIIFAVFLGNSNYLIYHIYHLNLSLFIFFVYLWICCFVDLCSYLFVLTLHMHLQPAMIREMNTINFENVKWYQAGGYSQSTGRPLGSILCLSPLLSILFVVKQEEQSFFMIHNPLLLTCNRSWSGGITSL